jgi:hypothetical protein
MEHPVDSRDCRAEGLVACQIAADHVRREPLQVDEIAGRASQHADPVPFPDQPLSEVRADKTLTSRDECEHG